MGDIEIERAIPQFVLYKFNTYKIVKLSLFVCFDSQGCLKNLCIKLSVGFSFMGAA